MEEDLTSISNQSDLQALVKALGAAQRDNLPLSRWIAIHQYQVSKEDLEASKPKGNDYYHVGAIVECMCASQSVDSESTRPKATRKRHERRSRLVP